MDRDSWIDFHFAQLYSSKDGGQLDCSPVYAPNDRQKSFFAASDVNWSKKGKPWLLIGILMQLLFCHTTLIRQAGHEVPVSFYGWVCSLGASIKKFAFHIAQHARRLMLCNSGYIHLICGLGFLSPSSLLKAGTSSSSDHCLLIVSNWDSTSM